MEIINTLGAIGGARFATSTGPALAIAGRAASSGRAHDQIMILLDLEINWQEL